MLSNITAAVALQRWRLRDPCVILWINIILLRRERRREQTSARPCLSIITIIATIITGSWWHGGLGEVKSSKDDNSLKDVVGKVLRGQYRKWGLQDRSVPKLRLR